MLNFQETWQGNKSFIRVRNIRKNATLYIFKVLRLITYVLYMYYC